MQPAATSNPSAPTAVLSLAAIPAPHALPETRVWASRSENTTAIGQTTWLTSTVPWGSQYFYDRTAADRLVGLDYFGARYFSAAQGRFTSPDEPLLDQDSADPQSWNIYAYGRNNPLRFVDPTGTTTCDANGNNCYDSVTVTDKAPGLNPIQEMLLRSLFNTLTTTTQVAQQTQQLIQPAFDWLSRPRNPWCLAGAVGAGASVGGLAGLAGGPGGLVTVTGGFLAGGLAGGGVGLSTCMSNSGPSSGDRGGPGGAQDKKLSASEVKKLEQTTGESAHQIKTEALGTNKNIAQYDLYKDVHGNVFLKAKGGTGEAIPTGLKVN